MFGQEITLGWLLGVIGFGSVYTAAAVWLIQKHRRLAGVRIRKF